MNNACGGEYHKLQPASFFWADLQVPISLQQSHMPVLHVPGLCACVITVPTSAGCCWATNCCWWAMPGGDKTEMEELGGDKLGNDQGFFKGLLNEKEGVLLLQH